MGFWSWIGLAEKKDIRELQSSVNLLIEENRLLKEANKDLAELITDSGNGCVEKVLQQMEREKESVLHSLQGTYSVIKEIQDTASSIQNGICDLKSLQKTYYDETEKKSYVFQQKVIELQEGLKKEIDAEGTAFRKESEENKNAIVESIRSNQDMYLSAVESGLEEIKKYDTELMNCLDRIKTQNDGIARDVQTDKELLQNKIELIADSMQQLWAIMKAIWVDSVLSDIDSL